MHKFLWFLLLFGFTSLPVCAQQKAVQYLLVNRTPGVVWNQARPDSFTRESFEEIKRALPEAPGTKVRPGVSFIFSYLNAADEEILKTSLRSFLQTAQETDTPVLITLDGENWWGARPDLWNWWDENKPGFNPANRENVEWTGWSPDNAVKIAWRNWGRQIRVLPPPNLMGVRYREACHQKMGLLIPIILDWAKALPPEKQELFIGIKLGWESSIGVNAWHYPNGNALLNKPESDDPKSGLKTDILPSRGVATIGYAAVKTAGIRTQGEITEADLAEVTRRHLADLSREAARLGVPREKLFTHAGGWKEGELLYQAAVNKWSCPGWSFYQHAADPRREAGVQEALKRSDAPHWAAVEWLYVGARETEPWRRALENSLADKSCRFLCIYNWEGIKSSEPILEAMRAVIATGVGEREK